jgi:hypothetical protein
VGDVARRLGVKPRTLERWNWKFREERSTETSEFLPVVATEGPTPISVAALELETNVSGSASGLWWEGNNSYSTFTNGGAYQQIVGAGSGYIYLFGVNAIQAIRDVSSAGIGLARVKATHAFITDKTKYEYFNGAQWIPAYAANGSDNEAACAYIIPPSERVRELSVAFNSYANEYMLMTLFANSTNGNVQVFSSPSITGPWSEVLSQLGDHYGNYAPMTHDRMMVNQGQQVAYFLSEAPTVYNVGNWVMNVNRFSAGLCLSDP